MLIIQLLKINSCNQIDKIFILSMDESWTQKAAHTERVLMLVGLLI